MSVTLLKIRIGKVIFPYHPLKAVVTLLSLHMYVCSFLEGHKLNDRVQIRPDNRSLQCWPSGVCKASSEKLAQRCTSTHTPTLERTENGIKQTVLHSAFHAHQGEHFKLRLCARIHSRTPILSLWMSHLHSSDCESPLELRDSSNPFFHLDLLHLQRKSGSCLSLKSDAV